MKKRKRIHTSAAAVVLAAAMVFAIPAAAQPAQAASGTTSYAAVEASQAVVTAAAKKASLSKNTVVLTVKGKQKIKVKNRNGKKVTWSSNNSSIATVSSNGTIQGVKTGKTTIKAKVGKKTLKCTVYVKSGYGTATGNVTYHYNAYLGYMADTGARVYFIPTDGSAGKNTIAESQFSYSYNFSSLARKYVYAAEVDGNGMYTIDEIPAGTYTVLIISDTQTEEEWFEASSEKAYYNDIALCFSGLSNKSARNLAKSIRMYQYDVTFNVKIKKGKTTTVSHAFPYTYI